MAKNTMNKKINAVAKSAKKHPGAAITVAVGAALSVAGNLVIGGMTIAKAVKNKKAAKAADPEPAPAPAPQQPAADNSNPEENKENK